MDTVLYLLLSSMLLALWCVPFGLRPDLRRRMIRTGIVGIALALVGEVWHLHDYWQPPTIVGTGVLSPEDAIFGFATVGLSTTLYDAVFGTKDVSGAMPHPRLFLLLFLGGFASLLIGSTFLGYNSLLVSMAAFAACAVVIVIVRPDLLTVSLFSGLLLTAAAMLVYLPLFSVLAPHYWDRYWLLAGSRLGATILHIPLTEIGWYVAWGMLAGIAPAFRGGTKKVRFPFRE